MNGRTMKGCWEAFTLKEGSSTRLQRIGGRDTLVLEPGTTFGYSHPLLSSRQKSIQLSGTGLQGRIKWQSYEAKSLSCFHQERLRCIVPPNLWSLQFPLLQFGNRKRRKGARCGNGYRASACSRSAETWAGGQSFCR